MSEFIEVLSKDPELEELIDKQGVLTIETNNDLFKRLIVSILRQQVSMASAKATRERLFNELGNEVTPEKVLETDKETLLKAGLSHQKAGYLHDVAEAFEANGYEKEYFEGVPDEEVISELTKIRGVGVWTAKMQLMFSLGREDVFPVEDLGIRKGMKSLYDEDMSRDEMEVKAEEWEPYRSYASLYIWKGYD